jgi:protein-disulfide isomerase
MTSKLYFITEGLKFIERAIWTRLSPACALHWDCDSDDVLLACDSGTLGPSAGDLVRKLSWTSLACKDQAYLLVGSRKPHPLSCQSMLKKVILCIFVTALAAAQTKPAANAKSAASAKPAAKQTGSATDKSGLPTEDTVNAFLFQMFGYDPTLTWKVNSIKPSEVPGLAEVDILVTGPQGSNQNRLYVSSDGKHAISGEVLAFGAHPFEEDREKLEKGVNGIAKGPAKAPVMIVEFTDLQCPHCKEAAPKIDELLAQEPNVRFVFQNFPLPSHDWAEKAAAYADCVGRTSNDAFWKFVQKTFEQQANITQSNADEKLKGIAADSGENGDQVAACAAKPETQARIEASVALGKSVSVNGTPTLFINGRAITGGAPVEILKKIVEFQASQAEKEESAKTK